MDGLFASIGDRISRVVATVAEKEFGDAIKQTLELQRQEWESERRKLEQQRRESEGERQKLEDLRQEWDEERVKHESQRRAWEQERQLFEDQRRTWEIERVNLMRRHDELQQCIVDLKNRMAHDDKAIVPFTEGDPSLPSLCMTPPKSITKREYEPAAPLPKKKSVIDVTSPEKHRTTTEPISDSKAPLPLSDPSRSSLCIVEHVAPIPSKDDTSEVVRAPRAEDVSERGAQFMTAKEMHRIRASVSKEVVQRGSPRKKRRSDSSTGSASTGKKTKKDDDGVRTHDRHPDHPHKHHVAGEAHTPPIIQVKNSPQKVRSPPSVHSRASSRGKKKSPDKKRTVALPIKHAIRATSSSHYRAASEEIEAHGGAIVPVAAHDSSAAPAMSTRTADGAQGTGTGSTKSAKVSPRTPAEIAAKQPKRRDSQAWIVASNFPRNSTKVKASASRKSSTTHRYPKDTHTPSASSSLLDRITAHGSDDAQSALVPHPDANAGATSHGVENAYHVVRGKARAKVAPKACEKCIKFNRMTGQKDVDDSCRHRFIVTPPSTPAHFWDLTLDQM